MKSICESAELTLWIDWGWAINLSHFWHMWSAANYFGQKRFVTLAMVIFNRFIYRGCWVINYTSNGQISEHYRSNKKPTNISTCTAPTDFEAAVVPHRSIFFEPKVLRWSERLCSHCARWITLSRALFSTKIELNSLFSIRKVLLITAWYLNCVNQHLGPWSDAVGWL